MTGAAYAPITKELNWFIGERKIFRFTVQTDEDISLWEFRWQVRVDEPDDEPLITKTLASGIEIFDVPEKQVDVTIETSDTESLEPGTFVHALMRSDDAQVLSFGEAVLKQSAVRAA